MLSGVSILQCKLHMLRSSPIKNRNTCPIGNTSKREWNTELSTTFLRPLRLLHPRPRVHLLLHRRDAPNPSKYLFTISFTRNYSTSSLDNFCGKNFAFNFVEECTIYDSKKLANIISLNISEWRNEQFRL